MSQCNIDRICNQYVNFGATVCETVRPMPSDRCLSCPVCDIGVLWPNGWTDQDETWHTGRPWPWPHCVRWGPSSPSPKTGTEPPTFGQCLLWPNGWTDQDATWYGDRPRPKLPPLKKGAEPPIFGPCLLWPNGWMDQDATYWYEASPLPRPHCVTYGDPAPQKRGHSPPPPIFGPCLLWPNVRRPSELLLSTYFDYS